MKKGSILFIYLNFFCLSSADKDEEWVNNVWDPNFFSISPASDLAQPINPQKSSAQLTINTPYLVKYKRYEQHNRLYGSANCPYPFCQTELRIFVDPKIQKAASILQCDLLKKYSRHVVEKHEQSQLPSNITSLLEASKNKYCVCPLCTKLFPQKQFLNHLSTHILLKVSPTKN